MSRTEPDSAPQKPVYVKPEIVVSYTKQELKEEFKELQGLTSFVDLFKL